MSNVLEVIADKGLTHDFFNFTLSLCLLNYSNMIYRQKKKTNELYLTLHQLKKCLHSVRFFAPYAVENALEWKSTPSDQISELAVAVHSTLCDVIDHLLKSNLKLSKCEKIKLLEAKKISLNLRNNFVITH